MNEIKDIEPGNQKMVINTKELYPNHEKHSRFEERICEFLAVDKISDIVDYRNGKLRYLTESVIPTKQNSHPPLMLLFGNPAPNSVRSKCFFARKTGKKDHRIWPALARARIISFMDTGEDINVFRTKALFDLNYNSPFRVGLAVFHSIPSPASGPKWSGVAGLRKLFGARVLRDITVFERKRVESLIQIFIGDNPSGAVIAFQKDTYLGVKDCESQESLVAEKGKWRVVETKCSCSDVRLYRMPPTRYMSASWYVKFLEQVRDNILGE